MSAPKFTPGPWLLTGTTVYSLFFARGNERNRWDGTLYGDSECPREELQANAHLIAAAPELYEALEALVVEVLSGSEWSNIESARAALKKARGEA